MPDLSSPVERLIDQGLERYGKGDLDGALVAWESALALDPDDARAAGYVEYVRSHYELLRGQGGAEAGSELAVPFGLAELHDSDSYEIEIGETAQRARPSLEAYVAKVDDGWFLDEDLALPPMSRPLPLPARPDSVDAALTLELEADEPDERASATPLQGFGPWSSEPARLRPATGPTGPTGSGAAALGDDDDQTHDFGPARLSRLPDLFDGPHPFDDPAQTNAPAPPSESRAVPDAAPVAAAPDEPAVPDPADPDDPADADDDDKTGAPAPPRDPGEFDFDDGGDETAELKARHLGFVKLAGELDPAAPPQPGSAFAGPDVSTAELKVRLKKEALAGRPSLEPAPTQPDPAADLDLPDPDSRKATLDLGLPGTLDLDGAAPPVPMSPAGLGIGPPDDDERTQERSAWARARTPRTSTMPGTGEQRPASALDHLDLDDGGSRAISPPVIIDDPVMTEPSAFDPAHRNAPTRELPFVKTGPRTKEWPPVPTAAKTVPRGARVKAPSEPPATAPPPTPAPLANLLADLDASAPAGESVDDRTRRRITALLERAIGATRDGRHVEAVAACDLALAEAPDSAVAQKLVHRSRDAIHVIYQGFLGDLSARPTLAVPMHELAREKIDTRAAFLLSRIDGNLTFEEILDVSGMTRLEALRHLARMIGRGILSVR